MTAKPEISRGRKFINDLGIYAVGNLGAKLITFLLVPIYTFTISPSDFGYYDVCLTVIFFFAPILSWQLADGAFRFLLETDSDSQKSKIVSFVVRTILRNSIIVVLLCVAVAQFVEIRYIYLILAYGLMQSYFDISLQLARGFRRNKVFMAAGILNTFLVAMLTLLFLFVFHMGLKGLFYANIIARAASCLFVEAKVNYMRDYFRYGLKDRQVAKELLHYSVPLLPAVLIWMVLNGSNVFFIKHYLGLYENGIYAVLAKFSSILYVLSIIFYQTWQQNAIEQYKASDRDKFFSQIFNNYFYLLGGLLVVFPLSLRINYSWLVGEQYQSSSQYLFSNSFYMAVYALALFFELGYQCSKHTERILPSIIAATVIGIGLNMTLIPRLGIDGVILSGIITYGILLTYRVIDTRKYMKIAFDRRNYALSLIIILAGLLYYADLGLIVDSVSVVILAAVYLAMAPTYFRSKMYAVVKGKIGHRKNF